MIASSTTTLPDDFAVISSPSSIGKPPAVRVASVRQNLAMTVFNNNVPISQSFSRKPSNNRLARKDFLYKADIPITIKTIAINI